MVFLTFQLKSIVLFIQGAGTIALPYSSFNVIEIVFSTQSAIELIYKLSNQAIVFVTILAVLA
jgi:hypothetical protein